MMASHGDGEHNKEDYAYTHQFRTKEEKTQATVDRMIKNYKSYSFVVLCGWRRPDRKNFAGSEEYTAVHMDIRKQIRSVPGILLWIQDL